MRTESPYRQPNARRDPLHAPLSGKTVTVVGLGGAAEIALDLFRCGIERFRLFDGDVLEPGNLVRHACGAEYVGQNKAEAAKRLLERYSLEPLPDVLAFPKSVFDARTEFERAVAESDLVVVGTDTDASRAYSGEIARESGTAAVFVSMFERGCGGEILVCRPKSACYSCFLEYQNRKDFLETFRKTGGKADCSSSRDAKTAPGIGIDQSFLAKTASRASLDLLLEGTEHALPPIGSNWIVFSVSGIPGILEAPLSSRRFELPPHPECVCAAK